MKKTRYWYHIVVKDIEYKFVKIRHWLAMVISINKTKKKRRKMSFNMFQEKPYFRDRHNGLPQNTYFTPENIILIDLIDKKDIWKVKKGITSVFKDCLSHKFLPLARPLEDFDNMLAGLDELLSDNNSWYNTSVFDFENSRHLKKYIGYFEIAFRNFSASYIAIEMNIHLSDEYQKELSEFAKNEYVKPGMTAIKLWSTTHKKSGAKIKYGVSKGAVNSDVKSQLLYEQIQYIKKIFIKRMKQYFPLVLGNEDEYPYGIVVYNTNIDAEKDYPKEALDGLGINLLSGFFISESAKLFMSMDTLPDRDNNKSDMMYIYNPEKIVKKGCFREVSQQALYYLMEEYMEYLYKVITLKNLGTYYLSICADFRNRINHIRMDKKSYSRLLKIQYEFEVTFFVYKKVHEEINSNDEYEKLQNWLENNEYVRRSTFDGYHTYESFVDTPQYNDSLIEQKVIELERELDRKIKVSDSLKKYSGDKRNYVMAIIQLIIAIATFVLLLFPEKAQLIATFFMGIVEYINNSISHLFLEIKSAFLHWNGKLE